MGVDAVAKYLREELQLHVALDMDGYSNEGVRLDGLFSFQVAPVQVLIECSECLSLARCIHGEQFYEKRYQLTSFVSCLSSLQMSYLVYIGTTGSDSISHFVSDRHATPAELQHTHSEKLTLVPTSFFVNSHAMLMPPPNEVREHSLPPMRVRSRRRVYYSSRRLLLTKWNLL